MFYFDDTDENNSFDKIETRLRSLSTEYSSSPYSNSTIPIEESYNSFYDNTWSNVVAKNSNNVYARNNNVVKKTNNNVKTKTNNKKKKNRRCRGKK